MKEFLYIAMVGLPIWWLAQSLLCLRDYFRRRYEVRRMAPPNEEEKRALARVQADCPQKEQRPMRWYAEHPSVVSLNWLD